MGGGCIYDYSVSLSPNLWIMTFNLDLDLDLGLTIFDLDLFGLGLGYCQDSQWGLVLPPPDGILPDYILW